MPSVKLNGVAEKAQDPLKMASQADCVVIVTDHTGIDYKQVVDKAKLIVDTRNALKNVKSDKIVRLGCGFASAQAPVTVDVGH